MRRMLTNKNVVDIVNQGIESGEIEVDSGLPEIEAGDAGKVLAVNAGETGAEWTEVSSGGAFQLIGPATSSIYGAGHNLLPSVNASTGISLLMVDGTTTAQTGTYSVSGVGMLYNSLALGRMRNKIIPSLNNSIFLGDGPSSTGATMANYSKSIAIIGEDQPGKYQTVTDSILIDAYPLYKTFFYNSLVLGNLPALASDDTPVDCSIINNGFSLTGSYKIGGGGIIGSLLTGGSSTNSSYKNTIKITTNNWGLKGITMLGIGNYADNVYDDASYGLTMVGRWGTTSDAQKDRFVVGTGTGTNARANCFVAGNDSTNGDYIKVGDTMLTETQLQALLASL